MQLINLFLLGFIIAAITFGHSRIVREMKEIQQSLNCLHKQHEMIMNEFTPYPGG